MAEIDLITATIEVNGNKYKLQHPGNREWIRLKKTLYSFANDGVNMEPLLDYFFENCCFPEGCPKLTLDTVPLKELEEVWGNLALRFLRGELEPGYVFPKKMFGRK